MATHSLCKINAREQNNDSAAVLLSSSSSVRYCVKMAAPSELSLQEIHKFMVINGGKVTNHDLVKHFKKFLTSPTTQGKDQCIQNPVKRLF